MASEAQLEKLNDAELVFLRRALPHFMAGKSVGESLRAVLDDDARLVNAALTQASSQHFPTPCERGVSRMTPTRTGDVIFSEISRAVHQRLRAA
jgi:hypothetical protein